MIRSHTRTLRLDSLSGLELHNVEADLVTYRGRRAVRLIESDQADDGQAIAILAGTDVQDGVIDTALAGDRRRDAPEEMRGFVGVAFRVGPQGSRFECFYIVVSGTRAQLHVNGAKQPSLIVNDLKLDTTRGQIALWIGAGTVAHFSSVTVR